MKPKKEGTLASTNYSKNYYNELLDSLQPNTHVYNTLKYLLERGSITNLEAVSLDYNTRLSATIDELRKRHGVLIATEWATNTNNDKKVRYGRYRLICKEDNIETSN